VTDIFIKGINGTGCIIQPSGTIFTFPLQGRMSNNQSEWQTLVETIRYISGTEVMECKIHTDSLLLYKQLIGEYRIKSKNIRPIYYAFNQAKNCLESGVKIEYEYIYPEENPAREKLNEN
jgi:ribonuclease HI